MSWDWVPPREGEDAAGGPSPRLQRTVVALTVALAVTFAGFYLARAADAQREQCLIDRPPGVVAGQVETGWRWWPPGYECRYPSGTAPETVGALTH